MSNQNEQKPKYTIKVNGTQYEVHDHHIDFNQVVALAPDLPRGQNITYSITYQNADQKPESGVLAEGGKVKVKDGTKFDVTATDKS